MLIFAHILSQIYSLQNTTGMISAHFNAITYSLPVNLIINCPDVRKDLLAHFPPSCDGHHHSRECHRQLGCLWTLFGQSQPRLPHNRSAKHQQQHHLQREPALPPSQLDLFRCGHHPLRFRQQRCVRPHWHSCDNGQPKLHSHRQLNFHWQLVHPAHPAHQLPPNRSQPSPVLP
jgi:hypothetical protein